MKAKGLTTETVRAMAEKLCGKKSTYTMTTSELQKLLAEMSKK
jgi:phage gp16-like protein